MAPILTVVTITFNDPEGFLSTSKSFEQISQDWEWVIVDGSTDPTAREVTQRIALLKGATLIQELDRGRFHAMNKSLSVATGEIVCFLNGGDQFYDSTVPEKIIASYSQLHWRWAVGQTVAVDTLGKYQWTWPMPKFHSLKFRLGIRSYCHQATVVKKKILHELGGFIEDSLYSDWIISLALEGIEAPYKSEDYWARFLTGGVSGNQTLDYWYKESTRLRESHGFLIGNNSFSDRFIQKIAKRFLQSRRGQLIRPDLVKKYG
jgi:glycosyltransferase involved in cell wall biosynthesis